MANSCFHGDKHENKMNAMNTHKKLIFITCKADFVIGDNIKE